MSQKGYQPDGVDGDIAPPPKNPSGIKRTCSPTANNSPIKVNLALAKLLGIDLSAGDVVGFTLATRNDNYPIVVVSKILLGTNEVATQESQFRLITEEGGAA